MNKRIKLSLSLSLLTLLGFTIPGCDKKVSEASSLKEESSLAESSVSQVFTITWANYDGSLLWTNKLSYGETPEYYGEDPVKPADLNYTYAFSGWSPEIVKVTTNTTYTAQYTSSPVSYVSTGLTYSYADGGYTVTSYTGTDTHLEIPSSYDDGTNGTAPVTALNENLFKYNLNLVTVKLPNTLKTIGESAFRYMTSLISLTIPAGITAIADFTFAHSSALTAVSLPSSIQSIGWGAFLSDEKLEAINIPEKTTFIDEYAFSSCPALKNITVESGNTSFTAIDNVLFDKDVKTLIKMASSVKGSYTLPETVTCLKGDAIEFCPELTKVTLDSSLASFDEEDLKEVNGNFYTCPKLTSIEVSQDSKILSSTDGILYNKDKTLLLRAPEGIKGAISIEKTTQALADSSFENCAEMTSFEAKECPLTSIGQTVFFYCTALEKISLPNTIDYIGNSAFSGLSSFTFQTGEDQIKYLASSDQSVYYLISGTSASGDVTVRDNTRVISDIAFYFNQKITSLKVPSSVVTIGKSAFNRCPLLSKVELAEGIKTIQSTSFAYASALASLVIPESVTEIDTDAFYGDSGLNVYFKADSLDSIDEGNILKYVKACYFYSEDSNTDGSHWHYVDDVPTVWAA